MVWFISQPVPGGWSFMIENTWNAVEGFVVLQLFWQNFLLWTPKFIQWFLLCETLFALCWNCFLRIKLIYFNTKLTKKFYSFSYLFFFSFSFYFRILFFLNIDYIFLNKIISNCFFCFFFTKLNLTQKEQGAKETLNACMCWKK